MDTALEALFRAMLQEGWFCASNGETDSPTGFFGYVTNEPNEIKELTEAFFKTLETYGAPSDSDVIGAFTAHIDSNGIISIHRWDSKQEAEKAYLAASSEYEKWLMN